MLDVLQQIIAESDIKDKITMQRLIELIEYGLISSSKVIEADDSGVWEDYILLNDAYQIVKSIQDYINQI